MFSLLQLKQLARRLSRAPMFTLVTLIILAVGIGADIAMFSVVDCVLVKPLDYPGADQLIGVRLKSPRVALGFGIGPFLYFIDREQTTSFQNIGAYASDSLSVIGTGEPEHVRVLDVTDGTLPILGVNPVLGRLFGPRDDKPDSPETVLLSYSYWRQKFGGSYSVIGRSISVEGKPREIIGVLPRDFHFLDLTDAALILPMRWNRNKTELGDFSYGAIARLRPGTTLAQANADQARLLPIALDSFPAPKGYSPAIFKNLQLQPNLVPLKEQLIGDISTILWLLMASISMVLVVACANVANLLLVRVEGRRQEFAIRYALGEQRRRIIAEVLVESTVLGVTSGIIGLALAFVGLHVLIEKAPAGLPRLREITIDVPVLIFTAGIVLLVSFAIGMIPAIKWTRNLGSGLRVSGRRQSQSRERQHTGKALVTLQVAISLILLICTGLMSRTFRALVTVNPGFAQPTTLETFRIDVPETQIPDTQRDRVPHLEQDILDQIASIPSISSVAVADSVPMDGKPYIGTIFTRDRTQPEGEAVRLRIFRFISPGFFATMGMPLSAGRDLTWSDTYRKRAVAIVSENLAREYWRDPARALGMQIRASTADDWREIVGVVGNVHDRGMDKPEPSTVYWPLIQDSFEGEPDFLRRNVAFVIRSDRAGSMTLVKEIQRAVWSIDSEMPLADPTTVGELYSKSMARTSFAIVMLGTAGSITLALVILGLYAVISYAVSQRAREIGIRMALGAQRRQVTEIFVKQGLWLTGLGTVCGFVIAFAASRLMSPMLFGVSSTDPWTYAGAVACVVAVSQLACYLPSRRAASLDPANVLRAE